MCKTIVLKNGDRWKSLGEAGRHDVTNGEMVLICPFCHKAFVVSG
ncbi:MAG: hypothetical protein ACFFE6_10625 [Candidatus Thorarchaeota archaeon]